MPAQPRRGTSRMNRTARRAQLLDAARGVFVAQGFHATAMDDIADAAGVSKPVLYQHFPSKLALYRALLEASADEMVHLVRQAIASSEDNGLRVHNATAAYFSFVADEGQAFRLIFESDLRDEPAIAAIVDRATESCIAAISDTITADTGADSASARLLAAGLVGLSQVSARYWLAQADSITQDRAVELVSELAWRGISHFPRNT
ncbi:MAG: TetR family transcriptional regulator [Actinobacteria bacterium 69-20]|nr:TetR/AcrR family transcriptional regulator [Actinomycetota bacterium]OJV30387.1 MAG: TetR family transcriptional regulator [Actinobacteria bacterium 69-20]